MKKTKIVIVDDHQIVRDGINAMFLADNNIEVIGEATDFDSLLSLLKDNKPDVIVMDIALPGKSGIEITLELKEILKGVKILMLSANMDEDSIIDSIKAGANGFLPKNTSKEELVEAIQTVNNNKEYFGTNLSDVIFKSYTIYVKNENSNLENEIMLSNREIDTLKLLADGYSSKAISDKLCISPRTVETHKHNILRKLKMKNNAELIKYAIKKGLVKL